MDKYELKMEVYRIVRNHSDKTKSAIIKILKKNLPDVSINEIADILKELYEESL